MWIDQSEFLKAWVGGWGGGEENKLLHSKIAYVWSDFFQDLINTSPPPIFSPQWYPLRMYQNSSRIKNGVRCNFFYRFPKVMPPLPLPLPIWRTKFTKKNEVDNDEASATQMGSRFMIISDSAGSFKSIL